MTSELKQNLKPAGGKRKEVEATSLLSAKLSVQKQTYKQIEDNGT